MSDATLEALKELKLVWEGMNQHLARLEALEKSDEAQWLTIRALRSNTEALEAQVRDNGEALDTTLGNIDIGTEAIETLAIQVRKLRGIVMGMIAKDPSLMALPKDNDDNAPQEEDRRSYV